MLDIKFLQNRIKSLKLITVEITKNIKEYIRNFSEGSPGLSEGYPSSLECYTGHLEGSSGPPEDSLDLLSRLSTPSRGLPGLPDGN